MTQKMLIQEHLYGAVNSARVVGLKMLESKHVRRTQITDVIVRKSIILDISKKWDFFNTF